MPSLYTKALLCLCDCIRALLYFACICMHMGLYRQFFTGIVLQIICGFLQAHLSTVRTIMWVELFIYIGLVFALHICVVVAYKALWD